MEQGVSKNQIISQLSRSAHGKLSDYSAVVKEAAKQEEEFLAHLIAYDRIKGQIRDAKIALPILSLTQGLAPELAENSLAHLALLGPRELLRAYRFAKEVRPVGYGLKLKKLVQDYLHESELKSRPKWTGFALQHRHTLKELYTLSHAKPSAVADAVILKGVFPASSVFDVVAKLHTMTAQQAAGEIIAHRIPFLVAQGALGKLAKETDLVLALINQMSATELVTNSKMLEKLGMKSNPAIRAAYQEALAKAEASSKNLLKTSAAAEAVEDEDLKQKLQALQEKQISKLAQKSGIEGDWLVLGDKSPSMQMAMEGAKIVAATLARFVKGKVHLVFFDSVPRYFDATGKTLEEIKEATKLVRGGDGTSIGCGVQYILDKKWPVDGIAIVSDGQENSAPWFHDRYQALGKELGKDVPVYLYRFQSSMHGHMDRDLALTMRQAGKELQEFDLRHGTTDFYSVTNLVQTMKTERYGLLEEVMSTRLLTLNDVFTRTAKEVTHA